MAVVLVGVLVAVLVLAVAFAAVGREARRLDAVPPRTVYDLDEAVEHVADRLPDDVTDHVSYDDVRSVLAWNLDLLAERGAAEQGLAPAEADDLGIVATDEELAAFLAERTADDVATAELSPRDVAAILAGNLAYLRAIGAIGPEADEAEDPR